MQETLIAAIIKRFWLDYGHWYVSVFIDYFKHIFFTKKRTTWYVNMLYIVMNRWLIKKVTPIIMCTKRRGLFSFIVSCHWVLHSCTCCIIFFIVSLMVFALLFNKGFLLNKFCLLLKFWNLKKYSACSRHDILFVSYAYWYIDTLTCYLAINASYVLALFCY